MMHDALASACMHTHAENDRFFQGVHFFHIPFAVAIRTKLAIREERKNSAVVVYFRFDICLS